MFYIERYESTLDDMKFCESCKMKIFPSRPKFSIKTFGLFVILIFTIILPLIVIFLPLLLGLLIFLMWGLMSCGKKLEIQRL
ncbi:MAG: hypothetical protein ACFFA6_01905 [Promethearchaeota archaeon]